MGCSTHCREEQCAAGLSRKHDLLSKDVWDGYAVVTNDKNRRTRAAADQFSLISASRIMRPYRSYSLRRSAPKSLWQIPIGYSPWLASFTLISDFCIATLMDAVSFDRLSVGVCAGASIPNHWSTS